MTSTAATAGPRHGITPRPFFTNKSARVLMCAVLGLGAASSVESTIVHAATTTQTVVAEDGFHRDNAAGWGSADVGGAYRYSGQSGAFRVSSNTGTVASLQPGRSAEAYLPATSVKDTLVSESVQVPSVAPSALNVHVALEARRQADGSTYRGRVHLSPGGAASVAVSRTKGAAETGLGTMALAGTFTAGQLLKLEVQVTGNGPVSISVRAWPIDTATPNWQLTVVDSSSDSITAAGSVGVWNYVSGTVGATTVVQDGLHAAGLRTASTPPAPTPPAPTPPAPTPPTTPSATVYKSANFDSWPLGAVDPVSFNSALGKTNLNAAAYDDMSVVSDGRGGRAIRTTLQAGSIHSQPVADGGDNLFISLPASYDSACMQYDIRFDTDFDWSLGGKLPGLEGVAPGVAPATPTGGNKTELGWSGRGMWYGPKAYSWAGPTNMAVSYTYHSGQAGTYGDIAKWNKAFVGGKWHTVKQCYVMNTVGQSNGQLLAWMDGTQVVDDTAFDYRSRDDVHINYIVFSIFRGGNTLAWAGSHTDTIDVDNILVTNR